MAKTPKPKSKGESAKDKAAKDKRGKLKRAKDEKDRKSGDKRIKAKSKKAGDTPASDAARERDARDLLDPLDQPRAPPRRRTSKRPTTAGHSGIRPPAKPRRKPATAADAPLTDRVVNAIEIELDAVEKIIGRPNAGTSLRSEAERRARTLASLARTLSELKKMQSVDAQTKAADEPAAAHDDEAFRLDLARRLGIAVAEAKTVHPDEEPPV